MKVWEEKGFFPFRLEALTPVHIGGGDFLSPLEYVIKQPGPDRFEAWLVDFMAWLPACQGNAQVERALESGDMAVLRRLLNEAPNLSGYTLAKIRVQSPELGLSLFNRRERSDKMAEIQTFNRNPFTNLPYIPASSLKGAISTALTDYLNRLRKEAGLPGLREEPKKYREIMQDIYGSIGSHAMRAVKMADIPLPPDSTSIRQPVGYDFKPPQEAQRLPCEAIDPAAFNGAYGNLRIATENGKAAIQPPRLSPIPPDKLASICNDFYQKRYLAELKKFFTGTRISETAGLLKHVTERIASLDAKEEILLRIGHYSHIECVTVSCDPGQQPKGGTSRTLADSLPFGWVILKRCAMAEYQQGLEDIDAAFRQEADKRAEAVSLEQKKLKEEEERAIQRAAEEEAAREREKMLAAMSAPERALWLLKQPEAGEADAAGVFARLEEFGEQQKVACAALKHFWQKIGKWEGKQLSRKQKEKVAKVRKILEQ